jgi:acyl carrier protein
MQCSIAIILACCFHYPEGDIKGKDLAWRELPTHDSQQRLNRCFAGVFPDLSEREIPKASVKSVGSWDSIATLTLVSVIEEEFGVRFTPEQIDKFTSYDSILRLLPTGSNSNRSAQT